MATLRDVAQLAKVSITTASIVANGKTGQRRISQETARRVLDAMEQLHYVPNHNARLLRGSATARARIGVCWPLNWRPDLLGLHLNGLGRAVVERRPDCELHLHPFLPGRLEESLVPVRKGHYDALLLAAGTRADGDLLESLDLPVPVLLLESLPSRFSTVGVSPERMAEEAARVLRDRSLNTCALVQPQEPWLGLSHRAEAFRDACSRYGIRVEPRWTLSAPCTLAGGALAAEHWRVLDDRPPVLCFTSDLMARGAVHALLRRGISVPGEAAVLVLGGYGEELLASLHPSLTSVSFPDTLDAIAARTLDTLLQSSPEKPIHKELDPLVCFRDSLP